MTQKLITPKPIMQLARVLADADGMMEISDNDLVECGYVIMARAALDHLEKSVPGSDPPRRYNGQFGPSRYTDNDEKLSQPWKSSGVSKSTWYRQMAAKFSKTNRTK